MTNSADRHLGILSSRLGAETEASRVRASEETFAHLTPMLRVILVGLVKDWRRIAASIAVVVAAAIVIAIATTPKYSASATLLVLLSQDYSSHTAGNNEARASIVLDRDAVLKNEVEILTSPQLAKAVLRKVGLQSIYPSYLEPPGWPSRIATTVFDRARGLLSFLGSRPTPPRAVDPVDLAVAEFEKDLAVTPDKAGNIIAVTFRHPDPRVAAEVVNTLVDSYLVKRAGLFSDSQSRLLVEQADKLRRQLDEAARLYAEFKASNKISDYHAQREIRLRQEGEVVRDLQQADSAVAQAEQRALVAQAQLDRAPQDEVQYRGAVTTVRRGQKAVLDTLELDRVRALADLQSSKARRDVAFAQLEQVRASIEKLDQTELGLERLKLQRDLIEENYRAVTKALDERRLQEDLDARKTANVRIVQPADVPIAPARIRLTIVAAGVLLGLLAGVATAVASEVFRVGYIVPETLARSLGVPVLACVPVLATEPSLGAADRQQQVPPSRRLDHKSG